MFCICVGQDDNIQNLMTYVLELARYDVDVDLRDRARYFTALMGLAPQTSSDDNEGGFMADDAALEQLHGHAEKICLPPKLPPLTLLGPVALEGLPNFSIGSLSSMVSHQVRLAMTTCSFTAIAFANESMCASYRLRGTCQFLIGPRRSQIRPYEMRTTAVLADTMTIKGAASMGKSPTAILTKRTTCERFTAVSRYAGEVAHRSVHSLGMCLQP